MFSTFTDKMGTSNRSVTLALHHSNTEGLHMGAVIPLATDEIKLRQLALSQRDKTTLVKRIFALS